MEEIDPTEKHMGRTEMVHMGRANGNGFRRDWIGERELRLTLRAKSEDKASSRSFFML